VDKNFISLFDIKPTEIDLIMMMMKLLNNMECRKSLIEEGA